VINLISNTTNRGGLVVRARLDRRPYSIGKKISAKERCFRTVRLQLLPTLQPEDRQSLAAINRRLWAWVEGEYHRAPHRGLEGETPADRWATHYEDVRFPRHLPRARVVGGGIAWPCWGM
jgi:hypothetical protein